MRFTSHKRRQAPAVIIVSLIDVLIVVLIFLVSSTQMKRPSAVQLALPKSATSSPSDAAEKPLIVEITKLPPFLHLDGQPVTTNTLHQAVAVAVRKNPEAVLAIRADNEAPFGVIVGVMDIAKKTGLRNLSAYTKRAE